MNKLPVSVFFASDKNYLPNLCTAIDSLIFHANKKTLYNIFVLTNGLSEKDFLDIKNLETSNVKISNVDVSRKIDAIKDKVPLRDYYSTAIYFRLFIPSLFPNIEKAIYLDCDLILNSDIETLFSYNLGDNFVAAVADEAVAGNEEFKYYTKNALGIDGEKYFNSGVLVMNLNKFREHDFENKFYEWIGKYNFGTVAPDQDYLNCMCKNKVLFLDKGYNKMPTGNAIPNNKLFLIHYNMFMKPWKYDDIMFADYFWKFAKRSKYAKYFEDYKNNYSDNDKINDKTGFENLIKLATNVANSESTYKKVILDKGRSLI